MELTHRIYESSKKEQNRKKYGTAKHQCICCLKPMKEGEVLQIHMNVHCEAVHPSVTVEECQEKTGAESQGYFPIGNSCAKKMPKDFLIR
jgi:hypothetical protein